MARRYTGGLLSSKEQVTDANSASGIFSVQEAGALTAAGSFPTGRWTPQRSLRFRAANQNYLNRTFGTPTNNKVWTWSAWIKRGSLTLADADHLFFASPTDVGANPSTYSRLVFETDGTLRLQSNASASEVFTSSGLFRDPAAWYHIVLYMDAVNTTVRCYVNGTEITYASKTNPTNTNTAINGSGNHHRMGFFRTAEPRPMDGYMADVNFVDGQALTPSAFGFTDPETGTWVPKRYTGTYGNNGFYLDFRDNTSSTATTLGADRSGNSNNWTPNNFSVSGATATTVSFTSVGTTSWTVPPGITSVNYLVVAGGGAGGSAGPTMYDGGAAGGGAGGMLYGTMAVTPGTVYSIYVGAGASGAANRTRGASGDNSVLSSSSTSITAIGGGGGGGGANTTSGANGGSGGGGANGGAAGLGTAGQGNNGGYYVGSPGNGGGGAGSVGGSASSNVGANGGTGLQWPVNSTTYAGGGGGGGYQLGGGSGGSSIGGNGGSNNSNGSNASASTGSGGGGSGGTYNTTGTLTGGSGANGIIIVSYATIDSTYDSMVDVPGIAAVTSQPDWGGVQRGNYAVLSPLSAYNFGGTLSNGNLSVSYGDIANNRPTMAVSSGKWYSEITCTSAGGYSGTGLGITVNGPDVNASDTFMAAWYYNNGQTYNYSTDSYTSYGASWGTGDVIGVAWDCDNRTVTFYKNGVSQGLLSAGVMYVNEKGIGTGCAPFPTVYGTGVTTTFTANYGQRPFAYFPPAGFKSLCSTNLPNPVIKRPVEHFDVKTYTGNGSGLTVGTTAKQSSAYAINNSLRFRGSNSATLSRTPSVSGNRKVWTWSAWVKRGRLDSNATDYVLFSSPSFPSTNDGIAAIYFNANKIHTYYDTSGSNPYGAIGDALYLDTTSWMNIVWSVDAANTRHSVWVNGVLVSTDSSKFPPNYEYTMNNSGYTHTMGTQAWGPTNYFDGYMAEVNFVDGQALTPSSFGDFDANNNWMPKRYTGTYGTNGFYLPFTGDSFAGSFNGTTQYLQASLPATLTGAFTIEFFFYRNGTGNNHTFTLGDSKTSTGVQYYIGTSGSVQQIYSNDASVISSSSNLPVSNAWNHVAFTRDSGNVTRLFVNGVQVGSTWATSAAFSSTLRIGTEFYNSAHTAYTNGGLSNFHIVNGTALYTSNFTPPTSALTAVSGTAILTLQNSTIIDNSGNALSITNNGTVVTSTTMLGNRSKDYSPQGNNWTNNNIGVLPGSTLDIMIDSPADTVDSSGNDIGNYATLNPTSPYGTGTATSNANLTSTASSTANDRGYPSSLAASGSGKWYAEFTFTTTNSDNNGGCGIMLADGTSAPGESATTVSWRDFGTLRQNASGTTPFGTALSAGEVVMVAYDADLGRVWFGKQGTWFASGNPATNANPSAIGITTSGRFATYHYNSAATIQANFGQRPFAYTPPTGFKAINSKNLKDVGSYNLPDTFGNFVNTPDLVWIKGRSGSNHEHEIFDTVRGPANYLSSNSNLGNSNNTGTLTSFKPNGFDVGNGAYNNAAGATYVAWNWNRGKTPGFDIVNYGGDGVNGRMIPHNLGQVPAFYITKCLTGYNNTQGFTDWSVYHKDCPTYTGNSRQGKQALWLHRELAAANGVGGFFNTATATEFSPNQINYDNSLGQSYIAYLWAEVPGFSKMGSWTGNSSTDGPFIYTGFRPRWIMTKRYTSTGNWLLLDTARNQFNDTTATLTANGTEQEGTGAGGNWGFDILSNGFKIRGLNSEINTSGQSYIYVAFAESPFKYANAR